MTQNEWIIIWAILMCIIIFLAVKISTLKYYKGEIIGKNHYPHNGNEFKLVIKYMMDKKVRTKEVKVNPHVFEECKEGDEFMIALYDF